MGAPTSGDDDFVSEINVTPFVDVMLVLLIIFMVTAPMMTEGLEVALPKVETSEALPTESDHIIITVKEDNIVYIGALQTEQQYLDEVIKSQVVESGKQVFLKADNAAQYGAVLAVLDALRQNNIKDVGMVTSSSGSAADGSEAAPPDGMTASPSEGATVNQTQSGPSESANSPSSVPTQATAPSE